MITVPAYFNDAERTATIHAGQLAGFNVLQIINEPTAAALSYGLDKLDQNQTVFVFDLGGGTFDVTIMRIEGQHIKMLATNGDHRLGGKDWDDIIVNLVAEEFDRLHGENPLLDLQSYQELQSRALAAKIQLSSRPRTTIVHSHNGKSIKIELTRDDFEKICAHLVEKCKTICEIVMQEARMNWSEIDKILLVGGMTRMPMVRQMIQEISDVPLDDHISPDESVAVGAAIQGMLSVLADEDKTGNKTVPEATREQFSTREGGLIQVTNITSHSLGVVLVERQLARGVRLPDDQENDLRARRVRRTTSAPPRRTWPRWSCAWSREKARCRAIARRWALLGGATSLPAERLAGGVELPLQRQPGAGSSRGRVRQAEPRSNQAQHGPFRGGNGQRNGEYLSDQGGIRKEKEKDEGRRKSGAD